MARWLPIPASAHAAGIDSLMTLVHGLMALLFVGWAVYFIWALTRFRRSRQPRANYAGVSGRAASWTEAGIVIAEGLLLLVVALPMWFTRTSAPPPDARALVVRVIAEQYAWNVHYPGADGRFGTTAVGLVSPANPIGLDRTSPFGADDVVTINELHVPIGRQVVVQLSSKDVIHSFGLPNFRVKQDVIPGMLSTAWFTPTMAGRFDIACSQLCGLGHYRMRGVVIAEDERAFAQFIAEETARIGR